MDQEKIVEDVNKEYLCQHGTTEVRVRIDRAGRKLIAHQCVRCGLKQGNYLSQKQFTEGELQNMPVWDSNLERSFGSQRGHEISTRIKNAKQEERDAFLRRHQAFLKSDVWQRLRSKVLRRANYTCEGCGDSKATEVHHLNYARWGGNELLIDLLAVCGECHSKLHPKNRDIVDILIESRNLPENNRGAFFENR